MEINQKNVSQYIDEVKDLKAKLTNSNNSISQLKNIAAPILETYQNQELAQIPENILKTMSKDPRSVENKNKLHSNIDHNLFIKINSDEHSHKGLLAELYTLQNAQNVTLELQETYMPELNEIQNKLEYISDNQRGFFMSLFQNRQVKKQLEEAQSFVKDNYYKINLINEKYNQARLGQFDFQKITDDFSIQPQKYYQKLAQELGHNTNEKDIIIDKISSTLEKIKTKIDAVDINAIDEKIKTLWETLKEEQAKEAVKNVSLNMFLASGEIQIPISLDKNVRTLAEFENQLDIARYKGSISHKDYTELKEKIKKFTDEYKDNYYPKLHTGNLSKTGLELLKQIYMRKSVDSGAKDIISKTNKLYDICQKEIKNLLNLRSNPYEEVLLTDDLYKDVETHKASLLDNYSTLLNLEKSIPVLEEPKSFKVRSSFQKDSASYYAIIDQVIGGGEPYRPNDLPSMVVERVQNFGLNTDKLDVTLRPYQEFGAKFALNFKKTLLGDEMGLGKTIQAIAIANHLFQEGKKHSIVVAPLSVLSNWGREIERWSKMPSYLFRGNIREASFNSWKKTGGFLLLNYEQSRHLLKYLEGQTIDFVIVDEAHYIKNPNAKRSQNTNELARQAEYNLFLTGTPIENKLDEMVQLISVLNPSLARKLELDDKTYDAEYFKQEISLVYLRRKRDEVLKELPEIEEIPVWSNFSEVEQDFYDEALLSGAGGLMKMRRAGFYGKSPNYSEKIQQIINLCQEAKENNNKVIIFSYFKLVLNELINHIGDDVVGMISGDVSVATRQKMIDDLAEADDGAILLSQIDAGGVGLNIQSANIVILCEPQYKPSTENQAISRVYRMGQTKNVIVYRLLTEDSIDETLLELLGDKTNIFRKYAHDSAVSDAFDRRYQAVEEVPESKLKEDVLKIEMERYEKRKVAQNPSEKVRVN